MENQLEGNEWFGWTNNSKETSQPGSGRKIGKVSSVIHLRFSRTDCWTPVFARKVQKIITPFSEVRFVSIFYQYFVLQQTIGKGIRRAIQIFSCASLHVVNSQKRSSLRTSHHPADDPNVFFFSVRWRFTCVATPGLWRQIHPASSLPFHQSPPSSETLCNAKKDL